MIKETTKSRSVLKKSEDDRKLFRRLSEERDSLTSWGVASNLNVIADELLDAGRIDETVAAAEEEQQEARK